MNIIQTDCKSIIHIFFFHFCVAGGWRASYNISSRRTAESFGRSQEMVCRRHLQGHAQALLSAVDDTRLPERE